MLIHWHQNITGEILTYKTPSFLGMICVYGCLGNCLYCLSEISISGGYFTPTYVLCHDNYILVHTTIVLNKQLSSSRLTKDFLLYLPYIIYTIL